MLTKIASFPSRTPIQLDNIIVYSGPPLEKNKKSAPISSNELRGLDESREPSHHNAWKGPSEHGPATGLSVEQVVCLNTSSSASWDMAQLPTHRNDVGRRELCDEPDSFWNNLQEPVHRAGLSSLEISNTSSCVEDSLGVRTVQESECRGLDLATSVTTQSLSADAIALVASDNGLFDLEPVDPTPIGLQYPAPDEYHLPITTAIQPVTWTLGRTGASPALAADAQEPKSDIAAPYGGGLVRGDNDNVSVRAGTGTEVAALEERPGSVDLQLPLQAACTSLSPSAAHENLSDDSVGNMTTAQATSRPCRVLTYVNERPISLVEHDHYSPAEQSGPLDDHSIPSRRPQGVATTRREHSVCREEEDKWEHSDEEEDSDVVPFVSRRRRHLPIGCVSSETDDCNERSTKRNSTVPDLPCSEYAHRLNRSTASPVRQCSGPADIAESAKHNERRRKRAVNPEDGNAEDCRVCITKRLCLSKDRLRSRKSSKPRKRDKTTNTSFLPPASLKLTALLQRPKAIGRSVATTSRPRRRRLSSSHGDTATARLIQQDNPSISLHPELQEAPTWAVDRIVSSARTRGRLFYRVRWEDTWEPADTLEDCAASAIADYHTLRRARRR